MREFRLLSNPSLVIAGVALLVTGPILILMGDGLKIPGPLVLPLTYALFAVLFTFNRSLTKLNIFQIALAIDFTTYYALPALSYFIFGYTFYFADQAYPIVKAIPSVLELATTIYLVSFWGMGLVGRIGGKTLQKVPQDFLSEEEHSSYSAAGIAVSVALFAAFVALTLAGGQSSYSALKSFPAAVASRLINPNFLLCFVLSTIRLKDISTRFSGALFIIVAYVLMTTFVGSRHGILAAINFVLFWLVLALRAHPDLGRQILRKRPALILIALLTIPLGVMAFVGGTYIRTALHTASGKPVNLQLGPMVKELTQRLSALEFVAFIQTADTANNPAFQEQVLKQALDTDQQIENGLNTFLPKSLGELGEGRPMLCELFAVIYLNKDEDYISQYSQCNPMTLMGYVFAKADKWDRSPTMLALVTCAYLIGFAALTTLLLRLLADFPLFRPYVPALYLFSGSVLARLNYFFGLDHFISFTGSTVASILFSIFLIQRFSRPSRSGGVKTLEPVT